MGIDLVCLGNIFRDLEEFEDSKTRSQDESLSSYLNNEDMNKNSQTQVGLLPQYAKNVFSLFFSSF